MPDPSRCESRLWAEYVFFNDNNAGIVTEWWYHNPTSYWFLAERNTVTDVIIRTFPADDVFNERIDFINETEADRT